jgi:ubiquinone/menaquinone biosynthesis C-methylase UbiE
MDMWSSGDSYEAYVGRWSRPVAGRFLEWLDPPAGARWLDVGCGTGALTDEIVCNAAPSVVLGLDPSPAFVTHAAGHVPDPRALFAVGDARALPVTDGWFDVVVAGLMLNFVPERTRALAEMRRAARIGGVVAVYVWDYPGGMQLISRFWEAAEELDPAVRRESEGVRFGFCRPEALRAMFRAADLTDVAVEPVVVPTVFEDFDDLWSPFLRATGPAPAYVTSLDDDRRADLRARLQAALPVEDDGSIHLTARAWTVRGSVA